MKKPFSAKQIFCLMLSIFISFFACLSVSAEKNLTNSNWEDEGYNFITENNGLTMYAEKKTGLFKLVTQNGQEFYSVSQSLDDDTKTSKKNKIAYGSQLIIEYAATEDFSSTGLVSKTNSQVGCVNRDTVKTKRLENGIRVEYDFTNLSIFIPVEYTLEDGKLFARIITDEITEGQDASLISVNLLPSFGAGNENEDGYIFIPDGCGALMYFNSNKTENTYSANVYGKELSLNHELFKLNVTEEIKLPVFGICRPGNNAILGNINSGDGSARIDAMVGNDTFGQNICSSTMIYRTVTTDKFTTSKSKQVDIYRLSEQCFSGKDYIVSYSILSGEKSDYSALAQEYREYLISEKELTKNDNAQLVNLDIYGALEVAGNFLGIKYTKLKSLTGYTDVINIIESLEENGIKNPSFRYIGWQNDGIFNKKIPTKNKLIRTLGGRTQWKKLQNFIAQNDILAVYETDLLQYRKSFLNKAASTTFNKKAWQYQYGRSTYVQKITVDSWLNIKPQLIEKYSNKYLNNINKSVQNISLSTITNLIYSDFKENSGLHRSDFPKIASSVLNNYKKENYTLSGENANAYALPYLSIIYKAPTSSSGFKAFDRDVPFYQIVLKGYISMTVKARQEELRNNDEFLKAVETGSALLYNCIYDNAEEIRGLREETLYSSQYTLWSDVAAEHYKNYISLYNKLLGKSILKNYELTDNVMLTEFEDGIKVIVNYNYEDYDSEYGEIESRGFKVVGGEEE